MRFRSIGSRLPAPVGDILLFTLTVALYLTLWRLAGRPVDCTALAGAAGCAVALGWWDHYRHERDRAATARVGTGSTA